jgi:signal transduction histidine kinase/ActR/RegA family two-component response regulator
VRFRKLRSIMRLRHPRETSARLTKDGSLDRRARLIAGGVSWLVLSLTLWIATESYLRRSEQQALNAGLERTRLATEAIYQKVGQTLQAADDRHELAQARHDLLAEGNLAGARSVERHLTGGVLQSRFGLLQVAIIDRTGWLEWSSTPGFERVYLADREHFRVHAEDGYRSLFVSTPLIGRTTGRLSVQLARALVAGDGSFAGVSVVSLDPLSLSDALSAMLLGDIGLEAVFRAADGSLLASAQPDLRQRIGERVPRFGPFSDMATAARAGSQRLKLEDGSELLVSFRTISEAPLFVLASEPLDYALSDHLELRRVAQASVIALSLIVALSLIAALLWSDRRWAAAAVARAQLDREVALARTAQGQRMEALGTLAGGIAHDFNNLLQAVLGGAAAIRKHAPQDPRIVRLTDMLASTAKRGAEITGRLLAFARRGELQAEVVDVVATLENVSELLKLAVGPNIVICVEAGSAVPSALADPAQLETVLINLANNGRDAMQPQGGGTLTLRAAPEITVETPSGSGGPPAGHYVRIEVADTGIGMDLATLARAGEPFFTTKPKGKGTGLGLAMARGFAEQSGGRLRVESAPGQGTTVSLWLPVSNLPESTTPPPTTKASPVGNGFRSILVVDDDPGARGALADFLLEAGFEVHTAASGPAALAQLRAGGTCDVLVTDLSMPDLDGLELLRLARSLRPGLPGILVTGHLSDADGFEDAYAGGAFSVLRKPVAAADLSAAMMRLREPSERALLTAPDSEAGSRA